MKTMEDALDALYSQLNSGLEAAFAAIDSARSVSVPRPAVLTRYDDLSHQFPKIELLPGDTQVQYGDEDAPIIETMDIIGVDIFVSVAEVDSGAAGDTLSRYVEAIRTVLGTDDTLGGEFVWALVDQIEWAQLADALADKRLVRSVRIGLEIKRYE